MNSNQKNQGNKQSGGTHEQHVEAGRQSHKNDASRQSDSGRSSPDSNGPDNRQSGSGATRGGTSEQHSQAGRQSHKNDNKH